MIQLSLSIDEVNKILEALGNQPYVEVFQLINKIQQQASSQLQENENRSSSILSSQKSS